MVLELDRTYDFTADHHHPIHEVDPVMNSRLALIEGDITALAVDAIVNPGNQAMTTSTGISKTISDAAGSAYKEFCTKEAPCRIGESRITRSVGN
ncbi:MAG: Uncharacterized protein FD121_1704, partial [Gallionellaceae bacterium]